MNKYLTQEFEDKIINACKTHLSMAAACVSLSMNHNTFKAHAKRLGCYNTNPAGKGMPGFSRPLHTINEVLEGKQPNASSSKVRTRILAAGIKEHECEKCHSTEWLGEPIPLELHHKDGNHHNHKLENLEILCPNCHSLTPNHSKKK